MPFSLPLGGGPGRGSAFLAAILLALPAFAGLPDLETFTDPVDGRFDASRWLLDRKGFLPVPILITEPAVGYGGGAALLFFHRNLAPDSSAGAERRFEPPDITGAAAFGTENGSKGGGAFHLGFTDQRRWRHFTAVGAASVNLSWYGAAGIGGGERVQGIDFNLDGRFLVADVRRRFGDTEWWAGLRYMGADTEARFALGTPGDVSPRHLDTRISGLGLVAEYDGRDNIFTPNRGVRLYLDSLKFDEAIGSDSDYSRSRLALNAFHPLGERLVLGLRAEAQAADGDVPFYARPFIELRGIPAMRYQGDRVALLELEARWDLDGRWSAVVFTGAGRAAGSSGSIGSSPTRTTIGAGLRYMVARALGLHAGIDIARGPEETAIYIVAGSAWR